MAYMNPSRHTYAAVADADEVSVLGGITQTRGDAFAKLLYLAPSSRLNHPDLPSLIENLSAEAGNWGAFHVIAEVDETSEAFPALRRAGFAVYAWQRMWDVSQLNGDQAEARWERVQSIHLPAIQSLFQQIVPPLLHPVEPMPQRAIGLMCNDGFKCFVSQSSGATGIALTPLIHPEATDVSTKLTSLIGHLSDRRNRPVYLLVRSYQAWLEPVLADLGASAGPRQAVMVKHLAHLIKDEQVVRVTQPAGVSVQPSHVSRMDGKE
jgi:hypothetical protein